MKSVAALSLEVACLSPLLNTQKRAPKRPRQGLYDIDFLNELCWIYLKHFEDIQEENGKHVHYYSKLVPLVTLWVSDSSKFLLDYGAHFKRIS